MTAEQAFNSGSPKPDAAYIRKLAYYLPKNKVTNDDLAQKFPSWDARRTERITGIKTRYLADPSAPSSDMALAAAEKIFSAGDISKDEIDFLIVATQTPDYLLPCTACVLQHKLGLPTSIGAFDINLGCSGYPYGLSTARAMILSGIASNVLLIVVDKNFHTHESDVALQHILGDAATATLVSRSGFARIGEADFGTDGSGWKAICILAGGSVMPFLSGETKKPIEQKDGSLLYPEHTYMDGMAVFNFAISRVPVSIKNALAKNGRELDDIDFFVFHQANKTIIDSIAGAAKIPKHKVPTNLADIGNTNGSSIPILFSDLVESGRAQSGNRLVLSGFGVGLSWGTTVIEMV